MTSKKEINIIILISCFISAFLVWFIYFKTENGNRPDWMAQLPMMNAACNSLSAFFLIRAYRAIKKGETYLHILQISLSLFFSAIFLVGYLVYHHYVGDTKFTNQGFIRYPYFAILISHILCSVVALPLVLLTVYFALKKDHVRHVKIAKFTFPIWLYVSVTGVIIFLLLKYTNGS